MGVKDCGHHEDKRKKLIRWIFAGTLIVLFILLVVFLIIWAVLRPSKPNFVLQDATLYQFNLIGPAQLNSTFQVTIQSKNPNDKVGIYYDRLVTFATYRDQQITLPTAIPQTYQDTNQMNIWSPFLQGQYVPIAPYIGAQINSELSMGSVQLVIKLDGRVRFKVGTFISSTYRIHVECHAFIPVGNPNSGVWVAKNVIKYQLVKSCSVSV